MRATDVGALGATLLFLVLTNSALGAPGVLTLRTQRPIRPQVARVENPDPCGDLVMNGDQQYVSGFCWYGSGVAPPYFGAFAECYFGEGELCGVVLDLSRIYPPAGERMDVYAWEDESGAPGVVTCVLPNVNPGPIAYWPSITRVEIAVPYGCCLAGHWWVGYWGNWPGADCGWLVAADDDGSAGCPMTCIADGQGYPPGWQSVDLVWGPTRALGVGARIRPCAPVPVSSRSWGKVKTLWAN